MASCAAGYNGNSKLYTCDDQRYFLGTLPTCTAPCTFGEPMGLGITQDCAGIITEQTCTASCATGYSGSPQTYTCSANRWFYGATPTCTAQQCTSGQPTGAHITLDCAGKTTGQICTASCGAGYAGSPQTFSCETSNTFSGTNPTCTAEECTSESAPEGVGPGIVHNLIPLRVEGPLRTCM